MIYVSLSLFYVEPSMKQQLQFHGRDGTLEVEFRAFSDIEVRGIRQGERSLQRLDVPAALWGDAERNRVWSIFEKQTAGARQFIDAIIADEPLTPNFYDGLKVQQVIDAALESDRTVCTVSLV